MDPNATLKLINEAIEDGDREALIEALDNLSIWLKRDGFMPTKQID